MSSSQSLSLMENGILIREICKNVLSEIERIIADYSISEDFSKAINQGFGQFMWCSSDYIYKNPDSPILSDTMPVEGQSHEPLKQDTSSIDK